MAKTWMITGAGRGLGNALTRAALARHDRVVATARDPAALTAELPPSDRLLVLPLDMTRSDMIAEAAEQASSRFGGVDILVNNAAYALIGAVEESSHEEVQRQFVTNFFGPMELLRAVLPGMRARGSGHILNISSVAIFDGAGGASSYCASKWALEGMSECLAKEVAPFGVNVTLIEPGTIKTGFYDASSARFTHRRMSEYQASSGHIRDMFAQGGPVEGADPADMAQAILAMTDAAQPPFRFLVGDDAVARFERCMPNFNAGIEEWRTLSVLPPARQSH